MILIKKLSIIIPAYNEEFTILNTIKKIPKFPDLDTNIIVINDGSTDKTANEVFNIGVKVITNPRNKGLGFSFKKGLKYVIEDNADIIVILDADGQYHPKDLNKLIKPIVDDNADFVIGNRFQISNNEIPFIKAITNKIISIFISRILLAFEEVYDIQSSFRAFNKNVGNFLNHVIKAKYNYAQEMFILASNPPFRIKQIPVHCHERAYGKSRLIKNPIFHIAKIIIISLKTLIMLRIRFR